MSLFDLAFIIIPSPLVGVLLYGAYRAYVDPDGLKPTSIAPYAKRK